MHRRLLLALMAGLALSACVSEPPAVVIPGGRSAGSILLKQAIRSTVDQQRAVDQRLQDAQEYLSRMTWQDPDAVANAYPHLAAEHKECAAAVTETGLQLAEVDKGAHVVPPASAQKLAEVSAALHTSQAALESVVSQMGDQLAYLKLGPSTDGDAILKGSARILKKDVKRMHTQVDRAAYMARDLVRGM